MTSKKAIKQMMAVGIPWEAALVGRRDGVSADQRIRGYDGYPWNCIEIYDTDQEMQNNYDCSQGCEECKKRFWEAKEK